MTQTDTVTVTQADTVTEKGNSIHFISHLLPVPVPETGVISKYVIMNDG